MVLQFFCHGIYYLQCPFRCYFGRKSESESIGTVLSDSECQSDTAKKSKSHVRLTS